MVKLSVSDEKCFAELQGRLEDMHSLLTPLTERISPVDGLLRQTQERLGHYDPTVRLAILGHPSSGKSSLVNCIAACEVLPPVTTFELEVHPFDGDTVMRQSGRAVAVGEEDCRKLLSERPQGSTLNWHLHTRLPLYEGTLCHAASWVIVDTSTSTEAICPTLSSLASRQHSPNVFIGDYMFYCVDARLLGTPEEDTVLHQLIGDLSVSQTTIDRLLSKTTFVLTHIDAITDVEDGVTRIRPEPAPALKTVQAARDRFFDVARRKFPCARIAESNVTVLSSVRGLLAKKMLHVNPGINDMYDYCETMFGSTFMQTIDSVPEDELRRVVSHHSRNDGTKKSGASHLDEAIQLFDYNSVRHMMSSIASIGEETAEQLCAALTEAKPAFDAQVAEFTEDLETLVSELQSIVGHAKVIDEIVSSIPQILGEVVDRELQQFFTARIEELQYVLERRETAWFRERQLGTIVEMSTALTKLDSFLNAYATRRNFLEARVGRTAEETKSTWSFVDDSRDAILAEMEKEKAEAVTHFGDRFAHHVRDEFLRFFGDLVDRVQEKKAEIVLELQKACVTPLAQTQARCSGEFSLNDALVPFLDAQLVEPNERRTNNLLREMPEHVAFAALEISEEWRRNAIAAGTTAELALVDTKHTGQPYSMPGRLKFVYEAWRLAFTTVRAHQMCDYNIEALSGVTSSLSNEVLSRINNYVLSLKDGIREQRDLIETTSQEATQLVEISQAVGPFASKFATIRSDLQRLVAPDMESARRMSVAERANADA